MDEKDIPIVVGLGGLSDAGGFVLGARVGGGIGSGVSCGRWPGF